MMMLGRAVMKDAAASEAEGAEKAKQAKKAHDVQKARAKEMQQESGESPDGKSDQGGESEKKGFDVLKQMGDNHNLLSKQSGGGSDKKGGSYADKLYKGIQKGVKQSSEGSSNSEQKEIAAAA